MVRILDQLALDDEFGQLLCDFLVDAALYLLLDEDDDLLNHHLEALRHLGIYELVQISYIVIEVYFFAAQVCMELCRTTANTSCHAINQILVHQRWRCLLHRRGSRARR